MMLIHFLFLKSCFSFEPRNDQEVRRETANGFLRRRRANDGYEEYWNHGSFERECVEEICDSNEFHEVYDNFDAAEPRLVSILEGRRF